VSKLVRFDEDHFAYLLDEGVPLDSSTVRHLTVGWAQAWPGSTLMVMQADEFLDLTGQSQPLDDDATGTSSGGITFTHPPKQPES